MLLRSSRLKTSIMRQIKTTFFITVITVTILSQARDEMATKRPYLLKSYARSLTSLGQPYVSREELISIIPKQAEISWPAKKHAFC